MSDVGGRAARCWTKYLLGIVAVAGALVGCWEGRMLKLGGVGAVSPGTTTPAPRRQSTAPSPPGGCPGVVHSNERHVSDLAADRTHLFWSVATTGIRNRHGSPPYGEIRTSALTGGPVVTLARNQPDPSTVAIDDQYVYWAGWFLPPNVSEGALSRISKKGGVPTKLASTQYVTDLALDDRYIYWGDSQKHFVFKVPKQGGAVEEVAKQASPGGVAVDSTHIYWTGNGAIRRRHKQSGPVETLATNQRRAFTILLDASRVYWTTASWQFLGSGWERSALRSVPKAGGAVTEHAADLITPNGLAIDGNDLFVSLDLGNTAILRFDLAAGTHAPLAGLSGPRELVRFGGSMVLVDKRIYWMNRMGMIGCAQR